MKRFKLIGCVLLCIATAFGAAACTGTEEPPEPEPSEETTEYIEKSEAPAPTAVDTTGYTTYYFDAANGSDSADGLSETAPKKSLSALNGLIAEIGADMPVQILIKAGSEYAGTLTLGGFEAADTTPLLVGVYGQTEDEQYAKITAPADGQAVLIERGNVRVSGLECTSPSAVRGIFLNPDRAGAMKNVVVSGCYIHDVNFLSEDEELSPDTAPDLATVRRVCPDDRYSYQNGGIIAEAQTSKFVGPSWYENLWITDNVIERVSRTGIWVFSFWAYRPGIDWGYNTYYDDDTFWYHHSNVYVCDNDISYPGGDGIVTGAVVGGYIEGNTSFHAQYLGRTGFYNAGIWPHSCKEMVIQYNEAAYTHLPNGAGDGQGFDIDIGCSDITFRYNYSHHNEGGGILLCNQSTNTVLYNEDGGYLLDEDGLPQSKRLFSPWTDVDIRNNVFADNAGPVATMSGFVTNLCFENNTVIVSGNKANQLLFSSQDFNGSGRPGENWVLRNNIFCQRQQVAVRNNLTFCTSCTLENNVFYNFEEDFLTELAEDDYGQIGISADPGFVQQAAGNGLDAAKVFVPAGENFFGETYRTEEMNRVDFAGNDVTGTYYCGAFAKTAA